MIAAFRPNGSVTQRTWAVIVAVNVALGMALWTLHPATLLPRPAEVGSAWFAMVRDDGMLYELYVSFMTNLQALGVSCLISFGFAYLTVIPAARPLVVALSKARFFGMTGFVVFFTLAFNGGHALKVALLTFGISTFFLTSMASVVAEVPKEEFDHARTLRMGEWRAVFECVVLGRADQAFEVLRQNAAMGWMMLTMVEGVSRSEGGIGTMLLNENKHFHLPSVFALQLTVFAVGILQDWGITFVKRIVCPYSELTLERR